MQRSAVALKVNIKRNERRSGVKLHVRLEEENGIDLRVSKQVEALEECWTNLPDAQGLFRFQRVTPNGSDTQPTYQNIPQAYGKSLNPKVLHIYPYIKYFTKCNKL